MIILPWIPKTFWVVLTLTALPIACYLLILLALVKSRQMGLIVLTLMLLLSQVFFILYMVFGSIVYNTHIDDEGNLHKINVFNALECISLGLYYILDCVAHWVFAIKYWVVAC